MNRKINLKDVRTGLIFGIIFYGVFGLLDYYMLPQNYISALFIRYAIMIPTAVVVLILSYVRAARKYFNYLIFLTLLVGQLGIMAMVVIADPSEPAFYSYFVSSILALLACEFIFQVSIKPAILYFLLSIAGYFLIAVFDYKLFTEADLGINKYWMIGNFFFFASAGFISLLGHHKSQKSRDAAHLANQIKTSFLANISHEIRTPLNGITGCAALLSENNITDKNRKRYKEIIDVSTRQLLDIVDSVLLMSEVETGKSKLFLERISLKDLCYELTQQYKFIAEQKDLQFKFDCLITDDQEKFTTDYQKLRIIVSNLLNNAVKFTSEGIIKLRAGFVSEGLRIVVEDTGKGIDPENIENIFESFFQADKGYSREYGGNGLGLGICKSYIESLNGTIDVKSTPEKGSTFTVTLPHLSDK